MRVGIVGGGITGLALVHFLRERGVDAVVMEADDRPGGVIESGRADGTVVEFGPQRTRLTPAVDSLIDDLGLRDRILTAPELPLYVYHDGALRRVPRTVGGAVATDLLSVRGKLRALLEPLAGPPNAGESVEAYLTRAFGPEVADRLGGPLYAGLYASDPAEMPVEHSLSRALDRLGVGRSVLLAALRSRLRRRDPPPPVSFEDGLETLPRALYRRHRDAVRLGEPVVDVRSREGGYCLITDVGDPDVDGSTGSTVDAPAEPAVDAAVDEVVLTTPAHVTARLLSGVAPESARCLDELTYNPLAVVHLRAEAGVGGAGYQVALGEDLVTRGVTDTDALFGRGGVCACYLGGATRPEVVEWSADRIGRVASEEFERATGASGEVLSVRRWPRAMPAYDASWDALEGVSLPDGIHLRANYESRAGIPGRIRSAKRFAASLAERAGG